MKTTIGFVCGVIGLIIGFANFIGGVVVGFKLGVSDNVTVEKKED